MGVGWPKLYHSQHLVLAEGNELPVGIGRASGMGRRLPFGTGVFSRYQEPQAVAGYEIVE